MLSDIIIRQTLQDLDTNFQTAIPPLDNFYAKLSLLEVCGWIEEAMDELLLNCLRFKVTNSDNQQYIENNITYNSAFDYKKNFRKILLQIIGIMNVEILESNLDSTKLQNLKSELGNLKQLRNSAAHTHFQIGVTSNFDVPSTTLTRFIKVYEGLKDIETNMVNMNLTRI